mgnify:CR=1 FL=1
MLDCIQTTDKLMSSGYGYSWEGGKTLLSHRKAYANKIGVGPFDLPKGLVVRHTCDNPTCINEDHLIGGTQKQNIKDKYDRGRAPIGEQTLTAKLTEAQAKKILESYTGAWGEQTKLAKRFGVKQQAISKLIYGKTWSHLHA